MKGKELTLEELDRMTCGTPVIIKKNGCIDDKWYDTEEVGVVVVHNDPLEGECKVLKRANEVIWFIGVQFDSLKATFFEYIENAENIVCKGCYTDSGKRKDASDPEIEETGFKVMVNYNGEVYHLCPKCYGEVKRLADEIYDIVKDKNMHFKRLVFNNPD